MNRHRFSLRLFQCSSVIITASTAKVCCLVLLGAAAAVSLAQNTDHKVQPVLDVHVHAMDGTFPGVGPMCPIPPSSQRLTQATRKSPLAG